MSASRVPAALSILTLSALAACDGSPSAPSFGGNAVVRQGTLEIRGTDGADAISLEVTPVGVSLEMMGQAEVFDDVIQSISVDAGEGDDDVRVHQSAARDLDLALLGGPGEDEIVMILWPQGDATTVTVTAYADAGPGSDRTEVSWQSREQPFDAVFDLTVDGATSSSAEDDHVDVGLSHGTTNDPSWLGLTWRGFGAEQPGGDVRHLTLNATLPTEGEMEAELGARGDIGRDEIVVNANYSGVSGQQGRLSIDADMGEGDNRFERGVVSGAPDIVLETNVVSGAGADTLILVDELGGDGSREYTLDVGDGDNATTLRFGDGVRGARPSPGTRTVGASYRSGAGTSSVDLGGGFVEPTVSSVTLDFGEGRGVVTGRYDLPAVPASDPGTQTAPSRMEVVILSPAGSDVDLVMDIPDPSPDDGGDEPGSVALTGAGMHEVRLELLRILDPPPAGGSAPEEEWALQVSGLDLAGSATLTGTSGGSLRRLVYVQDSVRIGGGAALDVVLTGHDGDDAILAHVLGVAGDGAFDLVADGGSGADVVAALSDGLDPSGTGALAFEVRGADGDDVNGLRSPGALQRVGPVVHGIDAGAGTDLCHAAGDVSTAACETVEGVTTQFIQMLADLFGAELAEVWGAGTSP